MSSLTIWASRRDAYESDVEAYAITKELSRQAVIDGYGELPEGDWWTEFDAEPNRWGMFSFELRHRSTEWPGSLFLAEYITFPIEVRTE